MARNAWTKEDLEALRRLVERHGAAGVAEKAKGSGKGRGRPPANSGDMFGVWECVQKLMRRDGILQGAACDWISQVTSKSAQKFLGKTKAGYDASSLQNLYADAEKHFKRYPGSRAVHEKKVTDWVEENKNRRDVIPVPTRMEVYLKVQELRHGKTEADRLKRMIAMARPTHNIPTDSEGRPLPPTNEEHDAAIARLQAAERPRRRKKSRD